MLAIRNQLRSVGVGRSRSLWPGLEILEPRRLLADISVQVFLDLGLKGSPQTGNPGVPGQTVYIDLEGTGRYEPGDPVGVTDSNGEFTFTGLSSTLYQIRLMTYPGEVVLNYSYNIVDAPQGYVVQFTSIVQPLYPSVNSITPYQYGNGSNHYANLAGSIVESYYSFFYNSIVPNSQVDPIVNNLLAGVTYPQVASVFANSAYYDSTTIAGYYTTFLGRSASPTEVANWISYMQSTGTPLEDVANLFVTGPAFSALHHDTSDFVQTLYVDLLARTPAASEVSTWVSLINGGMSRATVAHDFLLQSEARAIAADYTAFLGVVPTPDQVDAWLPYLDDYGGHLSLADVAALFAGGQPYLTRVVTSLR